MPEQSLLEVSKGSNKAPTRTGFKALTSLTSLKESLRRKPHTAKKGSVQGSTHNSPYSTTHEIPSVTQCTTYSASRLHIAQQAIESPPDEDTTPHSDSEENRGRTRYRPTWADADVYEPEVTKSHEELHSRLGANTQPPVGTSPINEDKGKGRMPKPKEYVFDPPHR